MSVPCQPGGAYLCGLFLFACALGLIAQNPPTTNISDTVYRGDGEPASGTLLISWPTFTTPNGTAIAAGNKSVTLGAQGVLSVALVSNASATPSGTVYTVVYQLGDGTVKTEYWIVPASSPASLATVRAVLGTGATAAAFASRQYVDSSIAAKATDAAVVHKTGAEVIAGIKQFSVSPSVPGPVLPNDAVSKSYVDSAFSGPMQTSGPWSLEGGFAALSVAAANKSKLGFGSGGKVMVSENGGPVSEVAKLDVNGSVESAVTAARFSQPPNQCNGSFATGIQSNGNANCSTPDQIQLAETTAPTGIANYGIFWFDSTCHCPKVISNNGQAVQLGLLNVFNSDANTLEQYNSTNPQTYNLYGTRTDASNYERMSLTYDAPNSYYVADVEKSGGSMAQRGFGIKLQGVIRWVWDTSFNFKPFADNARDIGTSSLRVRDFYLSRNLIMSGTASTYNNRTTAGPGLVALFGSPVSTTGNTAAIATATLCSTASCPAGQYVVEYYVNSTASCSTAGSAAASLTLGWTDDIGAKTLQLPLTGAGISGGNSMALGNTSNFGSGSFTLYSAGGAAITYSTSYTACTTGTGTYALRLAVRQIQ